MDVLHPIPHALEAGHLGQGEEGRQREERGGHEEHGRLHPSPIEMALLFDVQVTQGRILR